MIKNNPAPELTDIDPWLIAEVESASLRCPTTMTRPRRHLNSPYVSQQPAVTAANPRTVRTARPRRAHVTTPGDDNGPGSEHRRPTP